MENILEIKGLKKEYKDFSLHDISFSLPMVVSLVLSA